MAPHSGRQDTEASKTAASKWLLPGLKRVGGEKKNAGLPFAIDKTDIVGLVCQAWEKSFTQVKTNIKAVASRGWGPKVLNYKCLQHQEILSTQNGASQNGAYH